VNKFHPKDHVLILRPLRFRNTELPMPGTKALAPRPVECEHYSTGSLFHWDQTNKIVGLQDLTPRLIYDPFSDFQRTTPMFIGT
jgi:hypothetical protein